MNASENRAAPINWDEVRQRLRRAGESSGDSPEDVLAKRARELARTIETGGAAPPFELLTFQLGGESFAIELKYVGQVVRRTGVTPVPDTPPILLGLINLRGQITPVMDLSRLLGAATSGQRSWMLLLGARPAEFGACVDELGEVLRLPKDALRSSPDGGLLLGVTATALQVIDGEKLMRDPRLVFEQQEAP